MVNGADVAAEGEYGHEEPNRHDLSHATVDVFVCITRHVGHGRAEGDRIV